MNAKRLLSLLLALTMAVALLAGCHSDDGSTGSSTAATGSKAGGSSSNGSGSSNSTGVPNTADEVYGAGVSQETVEALQKSGEIMMYTTTIDFANNKFDKDPVMKAFVDWAKKYYGLTIKFRYRAWDGNMMQKFLVDYANKDAPDMLSLNYYMWPKAGLRQVVLTTDELKQKGVVGLDHPVITEGRELTERYSIGNKCYAVADAGGAPIIGAVNLDLFDQYKVKSPVEYYKEGTWDMDAYVKCCKEITRTLTDGTKIWGGYAWNYNWYLVANDARLIDWDKTGTKLAVTMTDPKTIRAVETVQALYNGGYTPLSEGAAKFQKGQMGCYFATTQNLAFDIRNCTFKWDVVPFPYGADNTTGEYPGEPGASAVVSSAKNPQGVINYIICRKIWQANLPTSGLVPEGDFYNTRGFTVFNEKQVDMYEMYSNKLGVDLTLGTGTLNNYYQFWNDLRDGSKTLKEAIDTYEPYYQEQVDFENEEAAKAR